MRFLAFEYVLEPLMEDSHDSPEYFPPIFFCFAMKGESLMLSTSFLVFTCVPSWSTPILARGSSRWAIAWSRLLELGLGPKSTCEWSQGHEILMSLSTWGSCETSFFCPLFFRFSTYINFLFKIATGLVFFSLPYNWRTIYNLIRVISVFSANIYVLLSKIGKKVL